MAQRLEIKESVVESGIEGDVVAEILEVGKIIEKKVQMGRNEDVDERTLEELDEFEANPDDEDGCQQARDEADEHVEYLAEGILDDGVVASDGIFDVVEIHCGDTVGRLNLD